MVMCGSKDDHWGVSDASRYGDLLMKASSNDDLSDGEWEVQIFLVTYVLIQVSVVIQMVGNEGYKSFWWLAWQLKFQRWLIWLEIEDVRNFGDLYANLSLRGDLHDGERELRVFLVTCIQLKFQW